MKPKTLLSILSFGFRIVLYYYVGVFLLNIFMNVFWAPESSGGLLRRLGTVYEKDGFEIPVRVRVVYPDTLVQVAGRLKNNRIRAHYINNDTIQSQHWYNSWPSSLEDWARLTLPEFDTIHRVDTLITKAIVNQSDSKPVVRGSNLENRFLQNKFNLKAATFMKSWIRIKPKTTRQFLFLLFRDALKTFFYIFISYQLLKSVSTLKSTFSFTENIQRRIKTIGWAIVVYSILKFQLDIIVSLMYRGISIESISSAINHIEGVLVFFGSRFSFDFWNFSIGLLLVILSVLMKRSSEIEEDWSLTI